MEEQLRDIRGFIGREGSRRINRRLREIEDPREAGRFLRDELRRYTAQRNLVRRLVRRRQRGNYYVKTLSPDEKQDPHKSYKPILQKLFAGRRVKVYTYGDGLMIGEPIDLQVPVDNFKGWWNDNFRKFYTRGASGNEPITSGFDRVRIAVVPFGVELPQVYYNQIFREGITNCMLTPLENDFRECFANAKSDRTKRRYGKKLNDLESIAKTYADGVPENKLQEIAEALKIGIEIYMPFQRSPYIKIKPVGCDKVIKYTNSRLDHLDVSNVSQKEKTILSEDEIQEKYEELQEEGKWCLYKKNGIGLITGLVCDDGHFVMESDFMDNYNDFSNINKLNNCKLDYINDKYASVIKEGIHFNGCIDGQTELNDMMKHIDMEKAYISFKKCKDFNGFMGKVWEWRAVEKDFDYTKITGYCRVSSFDFTGCSENFLQVNQLLKCYKEGCVYPSVELTALKRRGAIIEVNEAVYGEKINSLDFSDLKVKNKQDVPLYSVWCGKQFSFSEWDGFEMKCEKKYAEHLNKVKTDDCRVMYNPALSVAEISYKKKYAYSHTHILGYILAYARLNLLEQMEHMDVSKIMCICVDGIYYQDHQFDLKNVWRVKESDNFGKNRDEEFCSGLIPGKVKATAESRKPAHRELFIGAGGNGKTQHNLKDEGLQKKLYIAPSYKLCASKKKDYGVDTLVLARAVLKDASFKVVPHYNTIVVDEVSQMTEYDKSVLFRIYNSCRMVFCGDIGYQLPPPKGVPMSKNDFDSVIELTYNYRFTCEKHKRICELVRLAMTNKQSDKQILNLVVKSYRKVKQVKEYNPETDIILCSKTRCLTHKEEECNCDGSNYSMEYLDRFKGKVINKWRCEAMDKIYNRGDIFVGDSPPEGKAKWSLRHAFTIHSIQGETCEGTIYIDCRNLFDRTMLYTAISRARRYDQVKIIVDEDYNDESYFH